MLLLISVTSLFLLSSSMTLEKSIYDDKQISEAELSYLQKYKYIPEVSNHVAANLNNDNNGNQFIDNAIRNMQKFFNLTVTGRMNEETSNIMMKPRCGVSDIKISFNSEYNIGAKWHKKHLTWKVSRYTAQVTRATLLDVIEYALNVWAEVSGLTFEYSPSSSVDIDIGFYKRVHLNEPYSSSFDGRGNVLAHAYYPFKGVSLGGDTHMDDDELWAVTRKPTDYSKTSLAVVFVHEFGHALGLGHEPRVSGSIMRPIYNGWADKVILSKDDIAGMQKLYGKSTIKDTTTTKSPSTTTTTKSTTLTSSETTSTKSPSATTKKVKVDFFCRKDGIDTAIEHNKNSYLLFKGNKIRRVYINGKIRKFKFQRLFIGSLKNDQIDASIRTYTYGNIVYLFQGSKVHSFIYSKKRYREKNVELISVKFPGLPNNLDAAFTWSGDNKLYFLKGNKVYSFYENSERFSSYKDYPKDMSMYKGLPANIDAALNINKYNTTIFFKGNDYYKFIESSLEVESGYPKEVKRDWFDCFASDLTNSSRTHVFPISRITNNAEVVPGNNALQEKYNGTLPTEQRVVNQPSKGNGAMKLTTTFVTIVFALFSITL